MSMGFRIVERNRKVSGEVAEAFRGLPVANVSDCMSRMFASGPRLSAVHTANVQVAGPALTVRTRPGDNLMLHHALDIAEHGDFIVVDAGGDLTTAIMGEIMATIAIKRGVSAIAIYGSIRDVNEIRALGLPLYACGVTHRGPYKNGPGEINTRIALEGMVIEPGDLILADGDGLLCVPYGMTDTILAEAKAKLAAEKKELDQIASGSHDRSWVRKALTAGGCQFS